MSALTNSLIAGEGSNRVHTVGPSPVFQWDLLPTSSNHVLCSSAPSGLSRLRSDKRLACSRNLLHSIEQHGANFQLSMNPTDAGHFRVTSTPTFLPKRRFCLLRRVHGTATTEPRISQKITPLVLLSKRHFPCTHKENENTRFILQNHRPLSFFSNHDFAFLIHVSSLEKTRTNTRFSCCFLIFSESRLLFSEVVQPHLKTTRCGTGVNDRVCQGHVEMTPWTPLSQDLKGQLDLFNSRKFQPRVV